MSERKHEIVVSNIGTVYSGSDGQAAQRTFEEYSLASFEGVGRAAGEKVNWLVDGELVASDKPAPDRVPKEVTIVIKAEGGIDVLALLHRAIHDSNYDALDVLTRYVTNIAERRG